LTGGVRPEGRCMWALPQTRTGPVVVPAPKERQAGSLRNRPAVGNRLSERFGRAAFQARVGGVRWRDPPKRDACRTRSRRSPAMPEFSWNKWPVRRGFWQLCRIALLQSVVGKHSPERTGGDLVRGTPKRPRPPDVSHEPFQPEPEWHAWRRPCPRPEGLGRAHPCRSGKWSCWPMTIARPGGFVKMGWQHRGAFGAKFL